MSTVLAWLSVPVIIVAIVVGSMLAMASILLWGHYLLRGNWWQRGAAVAIGIGYPVVTLL